MRRLIVGTAAVIALGLAGCKGDSAPSGRTLSPAERQALTATLSGSPQMGQFGPLAAAALVYVSDVGQLVVMNGTSSDTYNAIGLWMDINVNHGGPVVSQFLTVLAWQGTGTTIQKLALVLGAGNSLPVTDSLGASFNGTSGGTAMLGSAPFGTNDVFVADTGTFHVFGGSFGGSTAFTQGTLNGTYTPGTITGSYAVTASNGTGSASQSADFAAGIPAVHLVVRGSY
jgi:hypothetical protein